MHIQYLVGPVQQRQTGGEIYHDELMRFLSNENKVTNEVGIAEANRGNMFTANHWCWQQMRKCQSEVIVEDSYYAACLFMSNWLAKRWRPRIVVFVQAVPEVNMHWSRKQRALNWAIMTPFLVSATLVVANSDYTRLQILEGYPVSPSRVQVLSPAGQKLAARPLPPLHKNDGTKRLLSVANICPKKGQKILIEALSHLKRTDWCLTLAGTIKDCTYYQELINSIRCQSLQSRVHLPGLLGAKALAEAYQAADILIHPSLQEAYGMAIAEAMFWGLPVVASRVGGIPEIITDGTNGILVPPGEPLILAQAIEQLLLSDDLRRRLTKAAYARAQILPTWGGVGRKFQQMLRALTY
jgi:glycosyltransferase involved in cell wall biosynthesis